MAKTLLRHKARSALFEVDCIPVTLEQLQLANKVAHAAGTGKMPRQSFASKHQEALESGDIKPGKYLVLGDLPVNHAAMAILDTFNDKTEAGERLSRSLLWRVIFASGEVYDDPRSAKFIKKDDKGQWIGWPLLEALAVTPMKQGQPVPVDMIYAKAEELVKEIGWYPESDPIPED